MQIAIRETTVTQGSNSAAVRLRISDAPLGAESASFELTILAELPAYQAPALAQLQRETIKLARNILSDLVQQLTAEIQQGGLSSLEPRRKE